MLYFGLQWQVSQQNVIVYSLSIAKLEFIIYFMKTILCALLIIQTLTLSYHLQQISYSGDNNAKVDKNQQSDPKSLPSLPQSKQPSKDQKQPENWVFLNKAMLGGQQKWVTPNSTEEVYPLFWITTYSINITNQCPKSPMILRISATGVYVVSLNGQKVLDWAQPWPKVRHIRFSTKCGINTLKITVFNYNYVSPAAIVYSLLQNTKQCGKCPQKQVYNTKTCSCENAQQVGSSKNEIFDKDKDKSIIRCPQQLFPCPKGHIWDAVNCQCVCYKQPIKCPGNTKWHQDKCGCFCDQKTQCKIDEKWDNQLCKCVQSQLAPQDHKIERECQDNQWQQS